MRANKRSERPSGLLKTRLSVTRNAPIDSWVFGKLQMASIINWPLIFGQGHKTKLPQLKRWRDKGLLEWRSSERQILVRACVHACAICNPGKKCFAANKCTLRHSTLDSIWKGLTKPRKMTQSNTHVFASSLYFVRQSSRNISTRRWTFFPRYRIMSTTTKVQAYLWIDREKVLNRLKLIWCD